MSEKVQNKFISGLDRDTSLSEVKNTSLHYNSNFRILTQGESTNLELTTSKGNIPITVVNSYTHNG